MCEDKYVRMQIKMGAGLPTIPISSDHRNGDWIDTDIYEGEQYMNTVTGAIYTRNGATIIASQSGLLYTEVDITSAEIKNIFSVPKDLLTTSGVGTYYDIVSLIFEYTHVTTPYTFANEYKLLYDTDEIAFISKSLTANSTNRVVSVQGFNANVGVGGTLHSTHKLNTKVTLTAPSNPTIGNGTIKVKITYKIVTFG